MVLETQLYSFGISAGATTSAAAEATSPASTITRLQRTYPPSAREAEVETGKGPLTGRTD